MTGGVWGNAENRFAPGAPVAGPGRALSLIRGDPDEFGGTSGNSANLLCIETGRLLGGCGGLDLDVEVDERERALAGTGRGSSFWGVGGGILSSDGDEETVEETEFSRANSGGSVGESDPVVEGGKAPSLVWNGLPSGGLSRLHKPSNQAIRKFLTLISGHEAYTISLGSPNLTGSRLGSRSWADVGSLLVVDGN